VTLTLTPFGQN